MKTLSRFLMAVSMLGLLGVFVLNLPASTAGSSVSNGSGSPTGACVSGSIYTETAGGLIWGCGTSAWVAPGTLTSVTAATYHTATECNSVASPAVCGSAASGFFIIAVSAGTVVVDTSAVTANSVIGVAEDLSLGSALGVTCNTATAPGFSGTTARSAGVSFTFAVTKQVSRPWSIPRQSPALLCETPDAEES